MKQPKPLSTDEERYAAMQRLRAPVLGSKYVKERDVATADFFWSKVFQAIPGSATRTAAILGATCPEQKTVKKHYAG